MSRFNLRSYGIIIKDNKLLVSKEYYESVDKLFLKLPGGGVELSESPKEALLRELQEELNINAETGDVLHIGEKSYQSMFDKSWVVCIYWKVLHWDRKIITNQKIDHDKNKGWQILQWVDLEELKIKDFTFCSDQEVVEKILK